MLRSLKITYDVPPNSQKALTLEHVRQLADYCQLCGLLGFTLKLAILVAFFRLLHVSNLIPPTAAKFDPTRHSTRADLTQLSQQDVPKVPIAQLEDDPLDPVQAMIDLYNLTPSAPSSDPMLLVPTPDGGYYGSVLLRAGIPSGIDCL